MLTSLFVHGSILHILFNIILAYTCSDRNWSDWWDEGGSLPYSC
jgi:hypothetical protein